jgi:hypothetical protein
MAEKKQFAIHIVETNHFELTVWASDKDEARASAQKIWREAPTIGQWELPETETEYLVFPPVAAVGDQ